MFENSRPRKAFDNCAVRAVAPAPDPKKSMMVCPKYPDGFFFDSYRMYNNDYRRSLALMLGCVSCPYKDVPLPAGDSAVQAIRRIGEQNSLNELEQLFDKLQPEPTTEPEK